MRTLARGTIGTWSSSVQLRILHTERAPARLSLVAGRAGDGNRDQDSRCESQRARGPCSESRVSNLRSVLCLSAFFRVVQPRLLRQAAARRTNERGSSQCCLLGPLPRTRRCP